MITLFRRVREKLLQQGQVSRYLLYALGEILLVVIGILIALQVNNWNSDRLSKKAASDYEARLLEDIYEEKAILEAVIKYQGTVRSYAKNAMEVLEAGALKDKTEGSAFLIDLYQSSQMQNPTSAVSTYQELISSGQIGLIENDSLRSAIITFFNYDWTNRDIISKETPYRENIRKDLPNPIQSRIREECGDRYIKLRNRIIAELPLECKLALDPQLTAKTVREILGNESHKKDLRFKIGVLDNRMLLLSQYSAELTQIIHQLEYSK